jgi:VWFA-related protein
MKAFSIISFLFVSFLFSFSVSAQNTQPTPPLTEEDNVVKISTDLVQIDAVVTDKQGNQVTNLTANDIEILQDGKPQPITNFSYVKTETQKQPQIDSKATKKADKNAPPAPPVSSRSGSFGRVLTFVVDDGNCALTSNGIRAAREGLEKFVNEQMQPNDLVAIYKTRRGNSLLQQYTSDKTRLLSIIRKIQWYPPDGVCSITGASYDLSRHEGTLKPKGIQTFKSEEDRKRAEAADNFNRDKQTAGAIGVLRYAINGLRNIGGRKTLFFLSDSLPISNGRSSIFDSYYVVQQLTERANRASVVINTIDVRGMNTSSAQAIDDFGIKQNMMEVADVLSARQMNDDSRQSGLAYAATETGGKFYRNMSYLDQPIQEALKIEKGYYLIGYEPDGDTFKGKKFHKIEIKLKRPDLVVSSRSGFSNLTDDEIRPKQRTGDNELYDAIIAPMPNAGLDLRVTAFFANTPLESNFVRAFLHVDGKQITFADDSNGMKKAVFDVIAVTLNEKNEAIDEFNRTHTVKVPAENLSHIQRNGLIYSADIPVKKAGAYNFRIAVRDVTSKQIGSAGQQIEVPDLKKSNIFLSELTLSEVVIKEGKAIMPSIEKPENAFAPVMTASIPAIRRFRPGSILGYSYKIYNSQLDKTIGSPRITTQVLLYRDGQLVSDSSAQPAQLEPQTDMKRISDYGYLRLPPEIATGDYALQIIIKDLQTNETSSQWIDFEIVR